jgi:hypothetical protein
MLKAFLDDSGTDDKRPLCIGGGVSPAAEWMQLEQKWTQVLQRYEVKVFHMTDVESLRKEFREWTVEKKDSFLSELVAIVIKHVQWWIGCRTTDEDEEGFKPYHDSAIQCVQRILFEIRNRYHKRTLKLFLRKLQDLLVLS